MSQNRFAEQWWLCRYRFVEYPINKLDDKFVNGNVTEVASKEDLVFALQNNLLTVGELVEA